ncbi:hypothetical protein, partial [Roseibium sp.]|uniref:hypothetical protein n=1 Tax=Roseibium sp. TaxID=1936156 RepID=UPI00262E9082
MRLSQKKVDHQEQEFPDGITVTMRTANSLDLEEAETQASDLIAGLIAGNSAFGEFGLNEIGGLDVTEMEDALGLSSFLTLALVFERVVKEWKGVEVETGDPAPLDRTYIGLFLLDPSYR